VKRLTDTQDGYVTNSEIAYFNLDDSYFIATDDNITYLFDGRDGHKIKELGVGGIRPWWIRWPRGSYYTLDGVKNTFDPAKHFYKYEGNEIRLYNVETLNHIVLRKFEEYTEIGPAGGEGDVSQDGRYWVLDGTRTSDSQLDLFVYDLLDDRKESVSPFEVGSVGGTGDGADFATISPSGNYIVIAWDAGLTDPYNGHYGVEVFDRATWEFVLRAHPSRIHIELGFDTFGEEVVFTAAGNTSAEIATFGIPGLKLGDQLSVRMRDGFVRKLLGIPSYAHFVLSYSPGQPDYIFVGYEDRLEYVGSWKPYWGEIFAVATDGSEKTIRLVHHRSRKVGSQTHKAYQPDFFINNRGDKIIMNSTYGIGGADLYMLDTGLGGTEPLNNAPVAYGGSVTTTEGQVISGELSASDADGDALTYALVDNSSLGTVEITNSSTGAYTYTPNTGVSGADMFTFKVNDGEADSNVATVIVTIVYPSSISLQSPSPGEVFDSSFLITNYQPTFSWAAGTFSGFKILFSTSPTDFTTRGIKVAAGSAKGTSSSWKPPSFTWKAIMKSSNNNGSTRAIYWKVIGTKGDRTTVESEVRSFSIGTPQLVAINAPLDGAILDPAIAPTFDFDTNCNTKFTLQISSLSDFSVSTKVKGFNFTVSNPNLVTSLQKTLSSFQWSGVKRLIGTGTGYFRIKAWDGLSRPTITEVRTFTIQ
jgi:hypothetical protein